MIFLTVEAFWFSFILYPYLWFLIGYQPQMTFYSSQFFGALFEIVLIFHSCLSFLSCVSKWSLMRIVVCIFNFVMQIFKWFFWTVEEKTSSVSANSYIRKYLLIVSARLSLVPFLQHISVNQGILCVFFIHIF